MSSRKGVLRRFVSYYRPHAKLFAADMTCAFSMAAIDLVFPVITRRLISDVIPGGKVDILIFMILGLTALYVVRLFLNYFVNYYGHIVGVRMEYDMRKDLFSHLQMLSFKFYDKMRTGQLMSRMMNDLNEITELAHHGPEDVFLSVIMMAGSVMILSTIEWRLTLIVLALVLIMSWFAITRRTRMSRAFIEVRKKIANVNSQLESSISGIRVSRAFANEEYEKTKFDTGNEEFKGSKDEAYKYMAQYAAGIDFIANMLNVSVFAVGGVFMYKGIIDVADLIAFLLYINLAVQPVRRLAQFVQQYESGMAGFGRFSEILEQDPDITEKENALVLEQVKGTVVFDDVTFSYNSGEDVLRNVSFDIGEGQIVALVGPSGGGKTTICNLIPRFYDVEKGSVKIDGIDIRDITLKSLRENIGIVQQDVFLFAGSIKDNILYGRVDANYDEMVEAAVKANIHDFVMSLPDKYDTYVGERGIQLSGGQKQRISIARVFLKNPPMLILDEATSALDNQTELIIQKSLFELSKGRTTLVIAHRLSTIRNADYIIYIDKEGIREKGTHDELMNKNGFYARLHNYLESKTEDGEEFTDE